MFSFWTWLRMNFKHGRAVPAAKRHSRRLSVEQLEDRTVPTVYATPDSYSVVHDHVLNATSVLANDFNDNSDPLIAILIGGPSHGTLSFNSDGTFQYTPEAGYVGADYLGYTAWSSGEFCTTSVEIIVTNMAPSVMGQSFSVSHDQVLPDLDILAYASDPDGDAIQVAIEEGPSHGQLTQNTNGLWDFTPDPGWIGTDSAIVTVGDGIATSWPASFSFSISNTAPIGMSDEYSVQHDQALERGASDGVLANDRDEDFDSLSAILVQDPEHGVLTIDSEGAFVYTPNANYSGDDTFSYFASDGIAQSGTATVTIHVINNTPTALPDRYHFEPAYALEIPLGSDVLANDRDLEDLLVASLLIGPQSGTLVFNDNGTFTYTPNENFSGDDFFTYKAVDALGAYTSARVDLSAGAMVRDNSYMVEHNQPLEIPVALGVLYNAEGTDPNATVSLLSNTSNGSLTLNPDGSFSYLANTGFVGTDQFTYELFYGGTSPLTRATASIDVTIVEPIGFADFYTVDTSQQMLVVGASNGVLANDISGDLLTPLLLQGPTKGSVTLYGDGSFVYSPFPGASGRDVFTYKPAAGATQGDVIPVNLLLLQNARPFTVTGTWLYNENALTPQENTATRRPLRKVVVEILGGDNTVLGTGATNDDGSFSIQLSTNPGRFRVQIRTISEGLGDREVLYRGYGGLSNRERAFKVRTALYNTFPNSAGRGLGNLVISNNNDTVKAFWTFDALVTAAKLHNTITSASAGVSVAQRESIAFPTSFTIEQLIHITPEDWNVWDTIVHEYGHLVQQSLGFFPFSPIQYVRRGAPLDHSVGVNNRGRQSWGLAYTAINATKLAFSEGFADFYSMLAQASDPSTPSGDKAVAKNDPWASGDGKYFGKTVNTGLPLQPNTVNSPSVGNSNGQDEELTIMRILWDLYDPYSNDDAMEDFALDEIELGFAGVLDKIRGQPRPNPNPNRIGNAYLLSDLWWNLTVGPSIAQQTQYGALLELNNVSPQINVGVVNNVASTANVGMFVNGVKRDSWANADPIPEFRFAIPASSAGGDFQRLLDSFAIQFFDNSLAIRIIRESNIIVPAAGNLVAWTPSMEQWNLIKAGGGNKRWFVEGKFSETDSSFYFSGSTYFTIT